MAITQQRHDAKYSVEVVELFREILPRLPDPDGGTYDPFAGTGQSLQALGVANVSGGELEPEFASASAYVQTADALDLRSYPAGLARIVTSPCYGNRFADQYLGPVCKECDGGGVVGVGLIPCEECGGSGHNGKGRYSYAISLGREVSDGSAASMHFTDGPAGAEYRTFHSQWLKICSVVLEPGPGRLVLNMSDHFRTTTVAGVKAQRRQYVVSWWILAARRMGFHLVEQYSVGTRRVGHGSNQEVKASVEAVLVFDLVREAIA